MTSSTDLPGKSRANSSPPATVLEAYVEENKGFREIAAQGFGAPTVQRVVAMVDRNEYKRRQGPVGIKITPRAFGRDWRLPIVNRFREP